MWLYYIGYITHSLEKYQSSETKIPQTIEIEIYKYLDQKLNNPSTSGYNRVRWQLYKSSLYTV